MQNLNSVIVVGAGTAGLISALMLHEKYPHLNIQIVKSDKIGIVGVGEGSTEHWRAFMEFCGINQRELIYKTKATVKLGIVFKDWNLGDTFVHSLSEIESNLSGLNRLDYLNVLYLNNKNLSQLEPGDHELSFKSENISNQFHFDTFKLNEFLVELCKNKEINFIIGEVQDVILDHMGWVQSISTSIGELTADFFIDCTGFHRIFSKAMNNSWISKAEYLPMNRAIAFPTPMQENVSLEPYTLATALSAGWSWRIPTQERYGNGYVFDNRYISADQALEEISKHLKLSNIKPGRDIPFEAGKIDKIWNKNVLHVGLSGSFAEPLEAQSIGFTIVQMYTFLNYSDLYDYNLEYQITRYNNEMDGVFQNVIDYLQAHYFTKRDDSKFWRDKPFKLTDFNRCYLNAFEAGSIVPQMFDRNVMFKEANWYQVIGGLKLIDKLKLLSNINKNRSIYNECNVAFLEGKLKNNKNTIKISHREYLKIMNNSFLRDQNG